MSFTSFTIMVRKVGRRTGTPETCGKILGISLSGDRWGCEGRRPIDLSTIPIPLESGSSDGLWSFHLELFYM